jgi:hypothetical protein
MTQPTAFGRKLPRNDWEGNDPLAPFKTCMDTSAGRAVAWATNGRVDKDGNVYRHSIHPHATAGINLNDAAQEIRNVAGLALAIKRSWPLASVKAHLKAGRGLIIIGMYYAIPREYREQDRADFAHAMWVSHIGSTGQVRLWDPLNRRKTGYGRWVPASVIWDFMASLNNQCGYVPLQHL